MNALPALSERTSEFSVLTHSKQLLPSNIFPGSVFTPKERYPAKLMVSEDNVLMELLSQMTFQRSTQEIFARP